MIKYTYNIVYIEIITKIKHYTTIEAGCFNECIKKFNDEFSGYEIIEVVRL